MGGPDRRRRSRSGRLLDALVWGTALGAAAGAVLGDAIDGVGAGAGAVIGAVLYAPAEAVTSMSRGAAEPKPLWQRIFSSALLMALFGWLLGVIYGPDEILLTAIISGALLGLLGLRPLKVALGLLVGAVVGALFQALDGGLEPALIAAAVTIVYRVVAAIAYRDRPLVRVMAEEVPASRAPLRRAVRGALAVRRRRLRRAAREGPGRHLSPQPARCRNPRLARQPGWADLRRGSGAPADPRVLRAHQPLPAVDHPRVAALDEARIRDLQALGRGAARPGRDPVQHRRGPAGDGQHDRHDRPATATRRSTSAGWIRTFADSGKPIYVGIYTSFRHEDRGYVSVGFPIPSANFTATLLPCNAGEHDLVLTSRTELAFPGHYLSSVDSERDALTVLKLLYFQEQIFVYVADGELKTDHSFYLAGQRFLTLHYEIERLAARARVTYAPSRRESQPRSAPSTSSASGANGTSVVTLTTMPSAKPSTAPSAMAAPTPMGPSLIRGSRAARRAGSPDRAYSRV